MQFGHNFKLFLFYKFFSSSFHQISIPKASRLTKNSYVQLCESSDRNDSSYSIYGREISGST